MSKETQLHPNGRQMSKALPTDEKDNKEILKETVTEEVNDALDELLEEPKINVDWL